MLGRNSFNSPVPAAGVVPLAGRAPVCPQNWYLVATAAEMRPGKVVARSIGGLELVLFRAADTGAVTAFTAHCRHAGCHLKHAVVARDGLRCALHHRVIAPDGVFRTRDGAASPTLRQSTLPVQEVLGGVFVFAGAAPTFDLPLPGLVTQTTVATHVFQPRDFDLPWSAIVSNSMDIDHLQAVHDRSLRQPPSLERLDSHRLRLNYRTRVTGSHLSDRIMKWMSNDDILGTITCIGGSMLQVETNINGRETFILMSMLPRAGGGTRVQGIAGTAGRPDKVTSRLRILIVAWLFQSFLDKDVLIVEGMDWHVPEAGLTRGDVMMRQLYDFLCAQPESAFPQPRGAQSESAPMSAEAVLQGGRP